MVRQEKSNPGFAASLFEDVGGKAHTETSLNRSARIKRAKNTIKDVLDWEAAKEGGHEITMEKGIEKGKKVVHMRNMSWDLTRQMIKFLAPRGKGQIVLQSSLCRSLLGAVPVVPEQGKAFPVPYVKGMSVSVNQSAYTVNGKEKPHIKEVRYDLQVPEERIPIGRMKLIWHMANKTGFGRAK